MFSKVSGFKICNFIKKDSNTDVFPEILRIFENIYFEEHSQTAAYLRNVFSFFFGIFSD